MKEKQTQAQQVKIILQELKDNKIPASTVESDLKFPSGILWKVKTSFVHKGCLGPLELSDDRFEKLISYRDKKIKTPITKKVVLSEKSVGASVLKKISDNKKETEKVIGEKLKLSDVLGSGRKNAGTTYKRVK